MFETPGFNLLVGAFLAGIVGLVTGFFARRIENASRRRRMARAIFTEMIQALTQMMSVVDYIDRFSRFRDPKISSIPTEIIRMMRPLDRNILHALGQDLGHLSSYALNSAIAFDGTMETESRRMREPDFDKPDSRITAQELRNRICRSLSLVADNAEVVAGDAYGRQKKMHGEDRLRIDRAREIAQTGDPMPGDNKPT